MFPYLFTVGDQPVATYGVLVAGGWLLGCLWLWSQRERMHLDFAEFWTLCYVVVLGGFVGSKAGYFVVEWRDFAADPVSMLSDWRSGWVFWTGFVGTLTAGWLWVKGRNLLRRPAIKYLPIADYFGAALPVGHALGRVGCFAEGCCHGRPTGLPWGAAYTSPASSCPTELLGVALHPVQLYEAAFELALGLFMMLWTLPGIRAGRLRHGTAWLGYIALYAVARFVLEFFRGDDRGAFLWPVLSPSQWGSLAALAIAASMLRRTGVFDDHPGERSVFESAAPPRAKKAARAAHA